MNPNKQHIKHVIASLEGMLSDFYGTDEYYVMEESIKTLENVLENMEQDDD